MGKFQVQKHRKKSLDDYLQLPFQRTVFERQSLLSPAMKIIFLAYGGKGLARCRLQSAICKACSLVLQEKQ